MDEPPQYFPYVGAYRYWDHVTTSVARPGGGALRCFCPRAQETLVTPLPLRTLFIGASQMLNLIGWLIDLGACSWRRQCACECVQVLFTYYTWCSTITCCTWWSHFNRTRDITNCCRQCVEHGSTTTTTTTTTTVPVRLHSLYLSQSTTTTHAKIDIFVINCCCYGFDSMFEYDIVEL